MTYDFTTLPDRRSDYAFKWVVPQGELPLWIADMDLLTPPEITQPLMERARKGVFGYAAAPPEWYDAYCKWWLTRYNCRLNRDNLIFCSAGMPAMSSIIRHITQPGDKIVLQTPVYNSFFSCVESNGRRVIENPLLNDNESYSIDFDNLECCLSDPATTLMLLCNPHNPVGRIWSSAELSQIGELCQRYGVILISDEIHGDLTKPGCSYVPFENVRTCEQRISCLSPSKTFNLAGLHTSAVYIPHKILCQRAGLGLFTDDICLPNVFAIEGAIAAYNCGTPWLEELRQFIWENKLLVDSYVRKHIPALKTTASEATYLMWLNGQQISLPDGVTLGAEIRRLTGLYLSEGEIYGQLGKGYLRMNVACPRQVVEEALERLHRAVDILQKG